MAPDQYIVDEIIPRFDPLHDRRIAISLPAGSQILNARSGGYGQLILLVARAFADKTEDRLLYLVADGESTPPRPRYYGSVSIGPSMAHVFEVGTAETTS